MSDPTSKSLKPTRWHLGMVIGRVESGEYLVCPECGEYAVAASPITWTAAHGPRPDWSHVLDGQPLCPVINTGDGVSVYVPANPVTRTEYDDANGCPCQVTYTCVCACTSCPCRADAELWRRLDEGKGGVPASGKSVAWQSSTAVHVHEEWTECSHRDGQCCMACHVDVDGDEGVISHG